MLKDEFEMLRALKPYITDKKAVARLIRGYRRTIVRRVLWDEASRIARAVDKAGSDRIDMLLNDSDWYKQYLIEVGDIKGNE